jgi:hypothetical protein
MLLADFETDCAVIEEVRNSGLSVEVMDIKDEFMHKEITIPK